MAKVEWSAGIDTVSGALSKPGSNPQHSCNKMLLGTHRTAPTENPNCNRLYLRKANTYGQNVSKSEDSILARTRFSVVSATVATRIKNLSTIAADRAAFEAQKNQAFGKKTLRAYLWKVCGDAYDDAHSQG